MCVSLNEDCVKSTVYVMVICRRMGVDLHLITMVLGKSVLNSMGFKLVEVCKNSFTCTHFSLNISCIFLAAFCLRLPERGKNVPEVESSMCTGASPTDGLVLVLLQRVPVSEAYVRCSRQPLHTDQ